MAYLWGKTAVGSAMAVNFAIPLATVLKNRQLWDEPMAVLAGNMSLVCTMNGLVVALIGVYDLVQLKLDVLCRSMQYVGFGFGIGIKAAHVCMAADQFVAVVHPLRHLPLMLRARPWLFAATWLAVGAHVLFGMLAAAFELETFAERTARRQNGTALFPECRWETSLANVYTVVFELEVALLSLSTAAMLVHTGIIGHRTSRLLRARCHRQPDTAAGERTRKFSDNYAAFKKILLVLLLTMTLDLVAPVVRLASRWHPMPRLNGFLHLLRVLAFIFEGWTYGLLNAKLRAAYRKTFCRNSACCSRRVENDMEYGRQSPQLPNNGTEPSVSVICPVHPYQADARE